MRSRALAALLLVAAPLVALANGRPPLTNGMHFAPGDAHSLYVATTFGFLISHDDGCTFHWVCEDAIGYGTSSFDPKYAIGSDGAIFATTFKGLHMSHDGGCSFQVATAGLGSGDPAKFSDVWVDALDIGPTGEIWAGTADIGTNNIYSSRDSGATWTPMNLASVPIWWKSLKVAPSEPMRIYATGYQVAGPAPDGGQMPPTAHLLRSDDDGAHWAPSALAGVTYGPTPIVLAAAVDPADKDKVFVTSLGAGTGPGDKLYLSTDGGATLAPVLTTGDTIRDVVIRDADNVIAATLADGTYASTDGGHTFTKLAGTPQLACLGQRADGKLFGCGANWTPDFKAVASSPDAATWTKVFRFVELAGPLDCPADTAETATCAPLWPNLQTQFGATGPTCGLLPDGPPADAPAVPPKKSGGCCDAGAGGPASALFGLGVGALLLRRRRGQSAPRHDG